MFFVLVLLALTTPSDDVIEAHFDRIDINHVYDPETGKHRFSQAIFWRWCREDRRFYSFGFKMIKKGRPVIRKTPGGYILEWDNHGRTKRATADFKIEWHSSYDPEVLDKQLFPDIHREW